MTVTAAGFDLDAKYRVTEGGILITGVQALARVLFDQIRADRRRGLQHRRVRQRLSRLAAGRLRPDPAAHRAAAGRARRALGARRQRGPGRHRGVGQPAGQPGAAEPARRRHRHVVRQGAGRGPLRRRVPARQPARGRPQRRRDLRGRRRPAVEVVHAARRQRGRAVRRGHADARPRHPPGGARPRPPRLRAVPLHRLLDRPQDRHRGRRRVRLGRRRDRPDRRPVCPSWPSTASRGGTCSGPGSSCPTRSSWRPSCTSAGTPPPGPTRRRTSSTWSRSTRRTRG